MQTKSITEADNRLSRESYTDGGARRVTGSECAELARNAMALYPDLPAENVAEKMAEIADAEFLLVLDPILRARHFVRTVRLLRSSDRREQSAQSWLFPDVQKIAARLPENVPVGKGKTVERAKTCYEDWEKYLKVLNREDREKHRKRIAAVKALMELWPARTKKTQGITLAEVDAAKARAAGLI